MLLLVLIMMVTVKGDGHFSQLLRLVYTLGSNVYYDRRILVLTVGFDSALAVSKISHNIHF